MVALTVFGVIAMWLAVGVASTCYAIYTDESAFRCPFVRSDLDGPKLACGVIGGPLTAIVVGCTRAFHASDRARVKKARLVAELEKELAAARAEVEAFLKKERAA